MIYLVWGRASYAEQYIIFVTRDEEEAISICKDEGHYVTKIPDYGRVSFRSESNGYNDYENDAGELVYGSMQG